MCGPHRQELQRRAQGSRLTGVVDLVETLFVGVSESFFHVHVHVHVPVAAVLVVSVLAVMSAPVHVRGLATGAPPPAFAAVSSRHRDADVDGLMV